MMPFDQLTIGQRLKLHVPAGRKNPVTQRAGAYRAEYEVTELAAEFVRLKDLAGGGWPPHGFKLSKDHYTELWAKTLAPA